MTDFIDFLAFWLRGPRGCIRKFCMILAALLATAPFSLTAQETSAPSVPDTVVTSPAPEAPQQPGVVPVDANDVVGEQTQPEPATPHGETTAPLPDVQTLPETESAPTETAIPVRKEQGLLDIASDTSAQATEFLRNGGPSIWVIAALSVITVALILWKIWRLALIGAWSRGKAGLAVELFEAGNTKAALATVKGRMGVRSKVVEAAILALTNLPESRAREEVSRVAKREIANAGVGLRALELIATIAPLLGLLGTVLGMIAAFQALQQSGNRADPALLAGGIWEALLTTAAGMAVAIPASAALTWFEAVIDRIRRDVEDGATRLFVSATPEELKLAAE
jgi:biopolymer transport protein ExbB